MLLDAAKCLFVTENLFAGRSTTAWEGHRTIALASVVTLLFAALLSQQAFSAETFSLQISRSARCQQVETKLKADGKLLVGVDDKKSELPIHVTARLEFTEKSVQQTTLRHYAHAQADIAVNGRTEKNRLSSTRPLIAIGNRDGAAEIYSPQGPLTRGDLELLSTQFDTYLLRDALPAKAVAVADTWPVADNVAAGLLGLDALTSNELQAKLIKADPASAEIQIAGTIEGKALGAKSKVVVDATVLLDRIGRRITQVTVQINETREVGHFAPGFEIEAMIATTAKLAKTPAELSAEKLDVIAIDNAGRNLSIDFASPSLGFAFIHDRRWRVTMHRSDLLVMRMVDGGNFIAQCNISPLARATDEQPVESAKFRGQVEQSLAEQQGRIDEASQATTDDGVAIVRIVASGKSNGVPITWMHYLLTHSDGRRAAVVFTLASAQLEQFATADHDLIGSVRFLDRENTANQPATVR